MAHKLMVVGAVESGKSTLIAALNGDLSKVKKTQSMIYDTRTVDTPGEYMENPRMYRYIIAEAQNIEYVVFVQDATQRRCIYPPGFAQSFNGMTIGVITKIDHEKSDVVLSRNNLKMLGLKGPIFETSSMTNSGIQELKEYIGI